MLLKDAKRLMENVNFAIFPWHKKAKRYCCYCQGELDIEEIVINKKFDTKSYFILDTRHFCEDDMGHSITCNSTLTPEELVLEVLGS